MLAQAESASRWMVVCYFLIDSTLYAIYGELSCAGAKALVPSAAMRRYSHFGPIIEVQTNKDWQNLMYT